MRPLTRANITQNDTRASRFIYQGVKEMNLKCNNAFFCGFKEDNECTKDFGHFNCRYEVKNRAQITMKPF